MKHLAILWFCACPTLFAQETLTFETVATDRKLWPREVTVSVPHDVPIVVNGKPSGSMKAGVGRTYPVKSVSASGVVIDALGAPLTFAATDTDILTRAEQLKSRQEAIAAAATPIPAPVAAAPVARPSATPAPTSNMMAGKLSGQLVTLNGKKLESFDAAQLGGKKYLALYFSASWCPPCRAFTPELVKMYKRKKSSRAAFDVVFVSSDKTEESMEEYMKEYDMEWPAVDFGKRPGSPLGKYGGKGIPRLVVIDDQGGVVSDSYVGEDYVGPTKVMKDLEKLLKDS